MGKKIIKWSEFLAESSRCKSKIWPVGSEFLYDSGELPAGLTSSGVHENDILNLQKPRGLTAAQVPGNATDWLITYCSVPSSAPDPGTEAGSDNLEGTIMDIIDRTTVLLSCPPTEILTNTYITDSGFKNAATGYFVILFNLPKGFKKVRFYAQGSSASSSCRFAFFKDNILIEALRYDIGTRSKFYEVDTPSGEVNKIGVTYSTSFNMNDVSMEAFMELKDTIRNLHKDSTTTLEQLNTLFDRLNLPQEADPGNYRFVCHKEDNGETAYEWVKE